MSAAPPGQPQAARRDSTIGSRRVLMDPPNVGDALPRAAGSQIQSRRRKYEQAGDEHGASANVAERQRISGMFVKFMPYTPAITDIDIRMIDRRS